MKFLITGNLGYIGPIVAQHFRQQFPDSEIVGFDTGFFADCLIDPNFNPEIYLNSQIKGDVRSLPTDLFHGVDAVIHLAAISNDPMGKAFEKVTDEINHLGTIAVAKMAKDAGVHHFVFASSCSVYGATTETVSEKSPVGPLTAYARSKLASERDLALLATEKFTITCLRFATACGYSPRLRLDLVLNDFVASAIAGKKIDILSDGTPWRPLIHVKDMAVCMEWAASRNKKQGDNFLVVNAGSNRWNYQVQELAQCVKSILPETQITINKDALPDRRSYQVNFDLYQQLAPKHQPKIDLRSAISDLSEQLKAIDFKDNSFRNSSWMRLKVLTELRDKKLLTEDLYWSELE